MRDFYKLTYRKKKAKLREQAIEWQGDFAENPTQLRKS